MFDFRPIGVKKKLLMSQEDQEEEGTVEEIAELQQGQSSTIEVPPNNQENWYDHGENAVLKTDTVRWQTQSMDHHQKLGYYFENRDEYALSQTILKVYQPAHYVMTDHIVREVHMWKGTNKHEGGMR